MGDVRRHVVMPPEALTDVFKAIELHSNGSVVIHWHEGHRVRLAQRYESGRVDRLFNGEVSVAQTLHVDVVGQ